MQPSSNNTQPISININEFKRWMLYDVNLCWHHRDSHIIDESIRVTYDDTEDIYHIQYNTTYVPGERDYRYHILTRYDDLYKLYTDYGTIDEEEDVFDHDEIATWMLSTED